VLTPNRGEAALLTGYEDSGATTEQLLDALQGYGVQTVCITEGANGITYRHGGLGIEHRDAVPVNVVDTTAAGDVFSGALAVALTEGLLFDDAAAFAQNAAAIAVTRAGATPSIPTRTEVESFNA
jgi:ribokinase